MDLRDEVMGVEGTIFLNHFLRTGFDMYTAVGEGEYVAEKAESATGWLFPVGDEVSALGYTDMFTDMLNALDAGTKPMEDFYDGYVVNAIMDACYRSASSRKWEPVELEEWRGISIVEDAEALISFDEQFYLIKRETMPDGKTKLILKDKKSGRIVQEQTARMVPDTEATP